VEPCTNEATIAAFPRVHARIAPARKDIVAAAGAVERGPALVAAHVKDDAVRGDVDGPPALAGEGRELCSGAVSVRASGCGDWAMRMSCRPIGPPTCDAPACLKSRSSAGCFAAIVSGVAAAALASARWRRAVERVKTSTRMPMHTATHNHTLPFIV
jgi:hypothetical protein